VIGEREGHGQRRCKTRPRRAPRQFFYVNPNLLSPLDLLDVGRTLPVEVLANMWWQQERTLQRQRSEASERREKMEELRRHLAEDADWPRADGRSFHECREACNSPLSYLSMLGVEYSSRMSLLLVKYFLSCAVCLVLLYPHF
jgi:hypothetical protein